METDEFGFYTEEELALLREQLRVGTEEAKAAAEKRGYKLHPNVTNQGVRYEK